MKKILLLLIVSLLMSASAFARCIFFINEFSVTPAQIGTEIELCVKAEFSGRLSSWMLEMTYPEGLIPTYAEPGADLYITYINSSGQTALHTPIYYASNDYTTFAAASYELGYWYNPDVGDLTAYGSVKWDGGIHEEMIILYVEVTEDFHGGDIVMVTECSSNDDERGGTIMDTGDQNGTFTTACHVGFSEPEAYAVLYPSSKLTFYYDDQRASRPGTTYGLNTGADYPDWRCPDEEDSNVEEVVFDPSFANARPTSTFGWFSNMRYLEHIRSIEYLNTSEVTNMANMFNGCENLYSLDVSHFNTAKVTDMQGMFRNCSYVTNLNMKNFITTRVTDMHNMFSGCQSLSSINVKNFNTANVTNMRGMFSSCGRLMGLDLSGFNTAKVTDMYCMFYGCYFLTTLNLSSFNTAKVTNMTNMFARDNLLETIKVGSGWNTSALTESDNMFQYCSSLIGGQGTTFDANHTDAEYAHIDGGPSNPGYLTAAIVRGDVNGDGFVNITDVILLINAVSSSNFSGINTANANVNNDSEVNITDVILLINYVSNGHW